MWSSVTLVSGALFVALVPTARAQVDVTEPTWRTIEDATIEGRAWSDLDAPYDRLPARAKGVVREPVWQLQRDSAGLCARFVTDAKEIRARWTLTSAELAMGHMPATGVSGLDLYGRDAEGEWRWVGVGVPSGIESTATLATDLDGVEREYLLYFPLYNGVAKVELGLPAEASFAPGAERAAGSQKPIVFYGTSITQGGCASRPGMVHTALLGRWLGRPVVNLGFSGNGKMDLELAPMLGELDAALFVIDCLPNMNGKLVAERAAPFVRALREARPGVPILLVEDRTFTNAPFRAGRRAHHAASRAALRAAYDELSAEGVQGLQYLTGAELLGDDGEGTVDSSHPTDLGFDRQARCFEPVLRAMLKTSSEPLHVLLLGDSISIGYTPFVKELLAGRARVVRPMAGAAQDKPENCAGTNYGVEHLERWLALDGGAFDVIHFNFGLHDLKRVDPQTNKNSNDAAHPHQAGPERYEAQLRDIARRLKATGAQVVFATTTPVPTGLQQPFRAPEDGVLYNRIAREVMEAEGIPINDLYQFVQRDERALQRPANVHFTEEGSRALAQQVAAAILAVSVAMSALEAPR